MSVILLKINVPNLADVLANFDRLKIHRSTTGEIGPYIELTTPSTRPLLAANRPVYEYQDLTGSDAYWYRSSYYNATTGLESSLSDPQQGEGADAFQVITVEELKDIYLFGVDLTRDDGTAFPDSMFAHHIKEAVAWLESHLEIPLTPRRIVEEKHDFFREEYQKWLWIQLEQYPTIAVEAVKMVLPGEQLVREYTSDWFHLQRDSGQLQLMPPQGSMGMILLGASGAWLPFMLAHARNIPDVFRVTYSAGFEAGHVPENIKAMVGKKAAMGPLNIAGDLISGAGIAAQSLSIDGLSQSISTTSCFTGDTSVILSDGTSRAIGGMVGEKFSVLSRENGQGVIVPGITAQPTLIAEVWQLHLASGEKIRANDFEKFLLADGSWRQLCALQPGDILAPVTAPDGSSLGPAKTVSEVHALGYKEQLFDLIDVGTEHCFALQVGVIVGNSATNAGYGARILQYWKDIKEDLPQLKKYWRGVRMAVS